MTDGMMYVVALGPKFYFKTGKVRDMTVSQKHAYLISYLKEEG